MFANDGYDKSREALPPLCHTRSLLFSNSYRVNARRVNVNLKCVLERNEESHESCRRVVIGIKVIHYKYKEEEWSRRKLTCWFLRTIFQERGGFGFVPTCVFSLMWASGLYFVITFCGFQRLSSLPHNPPPSPWYGRNGIGNILISFRSKQTT